MLAPSLSLFKRKKEYINVCRTGISFFSLRIDDLRLISDLLLRDGSVDEIVDISVKVTVFNHERKQPIDI